MNQRLQFETPENVRVAYEIAGLGTRFLAWFVDRMILFLLLVLLAAAALLAGVGVEQLIPRRGLSFGYVWGALTLFFGLGSFLYFSASECFMHGQTIGKRLYSIRVINARGFSLTYGSILLRNLFRVIDQLPVFWLVPFVHSNSQRLGDIVAGTVVVMERVNHIGLVRERLAERPWNQVVFRFDAQSLGRARRSDFEAIERILERWEDLDPEKQKTLLRDVCVPLAKRLGSVAPEPTQRLRFVEDLLVAEYRRQSRQLR